MRRRRNVRIVADIMSSQRREKMTKTMDAHSLYKYNDWYGWVIDKEWMYFDWKYRLTDLQCSDYRVIRICTSKNTRCSLVRCSSARRQTVKRQLNKKPADEDCWYWVWLSVYCCQAKTKTPSMIRWLTSDREPLLLTPRISYDATRYCPDKTRHKLYIYDRDESQMSDCSRHNVVE